MKKNIIPVLLFFVLLVNSAAQNTEQKPLLKMSDGQLVSHPVKIFVANANIDKSMNPKLTLIGLQKVRHTSDGKAYNKNTFSPQTVACNQTVSIEVDGTPITFIGTLMLFNFNNNSLDMSFYETGMRVLPLLEWTPQKDSVNQKCVTVIGEKEVYLGNPVGGRFWAIISLILFLIIVLIIKGKSNRTLDLIRISGQDMSLSLTQMLLWTLAVGGMVIAYGLMYLSVPDIPDTLIWLMGLSVTASAAGHYQNYLLNAPEDKTDKTKRRPFSGLNALVCIKTGGVKRLSIAKAQQLFWTLVTIALFIVKSSLEGKLWSVPEELVILMGLSHGSYLLRNQMEIIDLAKPKKSNGKGTSGESKGEENPKNEDK